MNTHTLRQRDQRTSSFNSLGVELLPAVTPARLPGRPEGGKVCNEGTNSGVVTVVLY